MNFDRGQFQKSLERREKARVQDMMPALRFMQAQSVVMAQLATGNEQWDRYLSFLQAMVDTTVKRKAEAQRKQNDPAIWDPQEMARLKSDILRADAMLEAWDVAMRLPKALIEDADKAKALIAEFEGKNEPADQPQS